MEHHASVTVAPKITRLPTDRPEGCPFDPPSELADLRSRAPLCRMLFPDGHLGWLVTSHRLVRAVLADSRFSARYELMHSPFPGPAAEMRRALSGDMSGVDPPEHTRYRQLVAGKFTVRRMRQLSDRIEGFAAEHLEAMRRHGPPVDLVEAYAKPVPALVICELLGVPYSEREIFQRLTAGVMRQDASREDYATAKQGLEEYLHGLVRDKRAKPTDDLLSDLTNSDLSDDELSGLGAFMLGAGLDTTANMLALGTFALLRHPDQLAALRADPTLIDRAVEELLRYLTIGDTAIRAALEDVELDGQLIRQGETVAISRSAANRDPDRFPDPDVLDLHRHANGHVAFGHGIHQCVGQQLARVEMRVAFLALLNHFPTLRLALPPDEIPLRTDMNVHGVQRLPVTWDQE